MLFFGEPELCKLLSYPLRHLMMMPGVYAEPRVRSRGSGISLGRETDHFEMIYVDTYGYIYIDIYI